MQRRHQKVIEEAPAHRLFAAPAHPYTRGLMAALPDIEGPRRRLETIPGSVPPPHALPPGCAFAARCPHVDGICEVSPPPLRPVPAAPARRAACARLEALVRAPEPAPALQRQEPRA